MGFRWRSKLLFAAFINCMMQLPTWAETSTTVVDELYALSGLQAQVEQVSDAIVLGFDSTAINDLGIEHASAEVVQDIREGLVRAFDPAILSNIILATLSDELTNPDIATALNWHQSSLGNKITQMELARNSVNRSEQLPRFMQQLQSNPPPLQRLMLLDELDNSWQVTDNSVSMMIDMQIVVSAAMMNVLPAEQRRSIDDLKQAFSSQRSALRQHYKRETRTAMLYIYAALSDDELQQYAQFAVTESGARYVQAVNLSLHKAMLEGSYRMGREIKAAVNREKNSRTF